MRTLKLNPHDLAVESFAAVERPNAARGTVLARVNTTDPNCTNVDCDPTGQNYDTCGVSCIYKCLNTIDQYSCAC
jgi:hypothetical protein